MVSRFVRYLYTCTVHHLFSDGRKLEHSKRLIKHAGALADVHNHGCFTTTTKEILEESCQSAVTERNNLVLSVTEMVEQC